MALIRHKNTHAELDVPDDAVAYFPDYERVAVDEDVPVVTPPARPHLHLT